jgi:hypothetical protein
LDRITLDALSGFQSDRGLVKSDAIDFATWSALAGLAAEQAPTRAVRLTLSYDFAWSQAGEAPVRLEKAEAINQVPLASESLEAVDGRSGAWVEWRDAGDACVYRLSIRDPIVRSLEASTDSGDALQRFGLDRPQGMFELAVAVVPAGARLLLFGPSLDPALAGGPAVQLAAFDVAKIAV